MQKFVSVSSTTTKNFQSKTYTASEFFHQQVTVLYFEMDSSWAPNNKIEFNCRIPLRFHYRELNQILYADEIRQGSIRFGVRFVHL